MLMTHSISLIVMVVMNADRLWWEMNGTDKIVTYVITYLCHIVTLLWVYELKLQPRETL